MSGMSGVGTVHRATSSLQHPTPDFHCSHSAYIPNISRLERRAEEISADGRGIGEAIRKMSNEQKERSRSRENSIQSSHHGEIDVVRRGALGRVESQTSRSRAGSDSIVDVNSAARWGGYSPAGYVSPSAKSSGSWSHVGMARKTSASGSTRLGPMVEPVQEGRPLDSSLARSVGSVLSHEYGADEEETTETQAAQSDFATRYDEIANQIEDSLSGVPPSPPKHILPLHSDGVERAMGQDQETSISTTLPERPRSADTFQQAETAFRDFDGVHFSTETEEFVKVDADGNEVRRISARNSTGGYSLAAASMFREAPNALPTSYAEPPPADGMVYYPAPVPRTLNLPKRLSQLPAAGVQAKRRSQVLSQMPEEARQSAYWIPPIRTGSDEAATTHRSTHSQGSNSIKSGSGLQSSESHPRGMLNERMSMANLNNLPPQLRASVYFDHPSIGQDVEVKSESAVATLDSILAASATAPVSAFTDHPFAGDVRRSVFAREKAVKPRTFVPLAEQARNAPPSPEIVRRRRSSSLGRLLRRDSSGNDLSEPLSRSGSRHSLMTDFNQGGKKLQKRRSQMSVSAGDELNVQSQAARTPANEISEVDFAASGLVEQTREPLGAEHEGEDDKLVSESRPVTAMGESREPDLAEQVDGDEEEERVQEDEEELDPVYAAPSTLLAELQIRKAAQKKRNKTAATAFPQGMHSTLLQLDAVDAISKEKRKRHKVALAWEGEVRNDNDADEDEDVPLGVLFPTKSGQVDRVVGDGKDWDRPLGLMERRELEDNEPLARRRNRMLGIPEPRVRVIPKPSGIYPAGQLNRSAEGLGDGGEDDGDDAESLVHKLRLLKTKDALDTAIADVAPKDGQRPVSTFTEDVLSQFGGLEGAEKGKGIGESVKEPQYATGGTDEEETLGQRKARLQREREGSAKLRDVADGCERPPPPARNSMVNLLAMNPIGTRELSKAYRPSEGTLLHASVSHQTMQKQHLLSTNVRSSSFHLDKSLVNSRRQSDHTGQPNNLLVQPPTASALNGGYTPALYNSSFYGIGTQPLQTSASTPIFGVNAHNSYFPSPTALAPAFAPMMTYPQTYRPSLPQQPLTANPMAYQALTGQHMSMYGMPNLAGYGFGAPPMPYAGMTPMGFGLQEPLDPKQRDAIDQWRMGVAPAP